MSPTTEQISTIDALTTAAQQFDALSKEVKKLEKERKALSESIQEALRSGLGVPSPEGNYSAQLANGGVVLDEKRVTYNPIENQTIPFFKSKGMTYCVVEAVNRDAMNKAIKEAVLTPEEVKENFTTTEAHTIKVVK